MRRHHTFLLRASISGHIAFLTYCKKQVNNTIMPSLPWNVLDDILLFEQYNSAKVWLILWSPCIVTRYPWAWRACFVMHFFYLANVYIHLHMWHRKLFLIWANNCYIRCTAMPNPLCKRMPFCTNTYVFTTWKRKNEKTRGFISLLFFPFVGAKRKVKGASAFFPFTFPRYPLLLLFLLPLLVPISFLTWVKQAPSLSPNATIARTLIVTHMHIILCTEDYARWPRLQYPGAKALHPPSCFLLISAMKGNTLYFLWQQEMPNWSEFFYYNSPQAPLSPQFDPVSSHEISDIVALVPLFSRRDIPIAHTAYFFFFFFSSTPAGDKRRWWHRI